MLLYRSKTKSHYSSYQFEASAKLTMIKIKFYCFFIIQSPHSSVCLVSTFSTVSFVIESSAFGKCSNSFDAHLIDSMLSSVLQSSGRIAILLLVMSSFFSLTHFDKETVYKDFYVFSIVYLTSMITSHIKSFFLVASLFDYC